MVAATSLFISISSILFMVDIRSNCYPVSRGYSQYNNTSTYSPTPRSNLHNAPESARSSSMDFDDNVEEEPEYEEYLEDVPLETSTEPVDSSHGSQESYQLEAQPENSTGLTSQPISDSDPYPGGYNVAKKVSISRVQYIDDGEGEPIVVPLDSYAGFGQRIKPLPKEENIINKKTEKEIENKKKDEKEKEEEKENENDTENDDNEKEKENEEEKDKKAEESNGESNRESNGESNEERATSASQRQDHDQFGPISSPSPGDQRLDTSSHSSPNAPLAAEVAEFGKEAVDDANRFDQFLDNVREFATEGADQVDELQREQAAKLHLKEIERPLDASEPPGPELSGPVTDPGSVPAGQYGDHTHESQPVHDDSHRQEPVYHGPESGRQGPGQEGHDETSSQEPAQEYEAPAESEDSGSADDNYPEYEQRDNADGEDYPEDAESSDDPDYSPDYSSDYAPAGDDEPQGSYKRQAAHEQAPENGSNEPGGVNDLTNKAHLENQRKEKESSRLMKRLEQDSFIPNPRDVDRRSDGNRRQDRYQ